MGWLYDLLDLTCFTNVDMNRNLVSRLKQQVGVKSQAQVQSASFCNKIKQSYIVHEVNIHPDLKQKMQLKSLQLNLFNARTYV